MQHHLIFSTVAIRLLDQYQSINVSIFKNMIKIQSVGRFCLLNFCAFLFVSFAQAQSFTNELVKLSPDEISRLRAVLAEPVPANASEAELRKHFDSKDAAAVRLSDPASGVIVTTEAIRRLPKNMIYRNNLGVYLDQVGRYDEALLAWKDAVQYEQNNAMLALYMMNIAETLIKVGRPEEAIDWLGKAKASGLKINTSSALGQSNQQRVLASTLRYQSQIEFFRGHFEKAIELATDAIPYANRSLEAAKTIDPLPKANRLESAINTYENRFRLLKEAGKFNEAAIAASDLIRLSRTYEAPARLLPEFYLALADLQAAKRDFAQAEVYARQGIDTWISLGYSHKQILRVQAESDLLKILIYRDKLDDAETLLQSLEDATQNDELLKARTGITYAHGLLHIKRKRYRDAVAYLRSNLADCERRYGADSFFVAQAAGLLGLALWKQSEIPTQKEGFALLERSIGAYMNRANADFRLDMYDRNQQQQWIFSTYIDAIFQSRMDLSAQAMLAADWVRSSAVQEALTDAAIRSAASAPAIASLVREDTDARNEIRAVRSILATQENVLKQLPEVEAKMLSRIRVLEERRKALRAEIKEKFPDYDQFVRPARLNIAHIQGALAPDEALVVAVPSDEAVYVWLVTNGAQNSAVRVNLTKDQLSKLVVDMRKTLDFGQMGRYLRNFNANASSELYQQLLKPLAPSLEGKKHLIVAAGGVLGQIPFGVLLTQPVTEVNATAPWLIKQAAITHIPSLGSWLAVKQFAKAKSAPEPLEAWGDPLFNSQLKGGLSDVPVASATRQIVLTRATAADDLAKDGTRSALKYSDIPALPETRDELIAMANLLKADPSRDLHLGAQANKASVLQSSKAGVLQKKKVVAFATHGLMAGDLPNLTQPALALAGTGVEDKEPLSALLMLDEVLNLKLNADWVILSACNTAAADGQADEALSGLARGFFYAGSRSLLVTHWAVDSESAKELTTHTMQNYMANSTQRKSESLRQAMLTVMDMAKYQHPAYWAPYALVGDGSR